MLNRHVGCALTHAINALANVRVIQTSIFAHGTIIERVRQLGKLNGNE